MTLFIKLTDDRLHPIDIGDNLDMTVGDLIKEVKDLGYNFPELYYQEERLYNLSDTLADLGIGSECTVNMIEGWVSCLYVNKQEPYDCAILLDRSLMLSYHINLLRRTRKYKIKKINEDSYKADELLDGRGYVDETVYTVHSDRLLVDYTEFHYEEGNEKISTEYEQCFEFKLNSYRFSSIHQGILKEIRENYPHITLVIEDEDSDSD